jgi:hypothetical protein
MYPTGKASRETGLADRLIRLAEMPAKSIDKEHNKNTDLDMSRDRVTDINWKARDFLQRSGGYGYAG